VARIYHDEDARFLDLEAPLRERMGRVLEEIRSGRFAEEWSNSQQHASRIFERVRAARDRLPIAGWEESARRAFRIGSPRED
jgi:ketol-acid reductoisomerase